MNIEFLVESEQSDLVVDKSEGEIYDKIGRQFGLSVCVGERELGWTNIKKLNFDRGTPYVDVEIPSTGIDSTAGFLFCNSEISKLEIGLDIVIIYF